MTFDAVLVVDGLKSNFLYRIVDWEANILEFTAIRDMTSSFGQDISKREMQVPQILHDIDLDHFSGFVFSDDDTEDPIISTDKELTFVGHSEVTGVFLEDGVDTD